MESAVIYEMRVRVLSCTGAVERCDLDRVFVVCSRPDHSTSAQKLLAKITTIANRAVNSFRRFVVAAYWFGRVFSIVIKNMIIGVCVCVYVCERDHKT